jgi:hypothetical protein
MRALQCGQVVAIVHFPHGHLVGTAANSGMVTYTRHVAIPDSELSSVMKEGRTIALLSPSDTEKLRAAAVAAKLEAHVWRHGHSVLLRHPLIVVTSVLRLCVENASNHPISCRATLGIDVGVFNKRLGCVRVTHERHLLRQGKAFNYAVNLRRTVSFKINLRRELDVTANALRAQSDMCARWECPSKKEQQTDERFEKLH